MVRMSADREGNFMARIRCGDDSAKGVE